MTSRSFERGRKTKPIKCSNGSAKKRKQKCSQKSEEDLLPSWDDVPSDDSLNNFIIDKKPVINSSALSRRLIFDSFDDSSADDDNDDERGKPVPSTSGTSTNRNTQSNSQAKRRKSSTPRKSSVSVLDILNFDNSPRTIKSTAVKKNKKSINEIVDKIVKSKLITNKEKRERFLAHAINKIKEFDAQIASFVAKTTPVNRNVVSASCDLRRSGRVRKSVRRPNCIIAHWHAGFINKVQNQLLPLESIDVEQIENLQQKLSTSSSFKTQVTPKKTPTPSCSSSSKKKRTSTAKKQGKEATAATKESFASKVVLQDTEEIDSPPTEEHFNDSLNVRTGVLRLKLKKQRKRQNFMGKEQDLHSVWKGRVLVVVNGDEESVLEGDGEFMVTAGDGCFVRNLEERKYLQKHYCKNA